MRTRIAPVARPGQLTIIGAPSHNGETAPGWYDLSTVVRGRLHPFIPHATLRMSPHQPALSSHIVAVGLAPLLGVRRLRHLDIPSTLRVAE